MTTRQQFLDEFGEIFTRKTFDHTCWCLEGIFRGRMKGPRAQGLATLYKSLDRKAQDAIREFAREAVELALADVALFIEEEELGLIFTDSHGHSADVREVCDGLVGDIVAHNGWIARFSKYPGALSDTPTDSLELDDSAAVEDISHEQMKREVNELIDELFGEDADKEL
ncbi:MAG: hypothetical protein JNG90_17760 [Planctomycetaceae bacterium]|nr:hypothetical protein [Planctomycetaceae bacterium]